MQNNYLKKNYIVNESLKYRKNCNENENEFLFVLAESFNKSSVIHVKKNQSEKTESTKCNQYY